MKTVALIVLALLAATPASASANDQPVAKRHLQATRSNKRMEWQCPSARRALIHYRLRKHTWLTLRGIEHEVPLEQPRGCSLVRFKVHVARKESAVARVKYGRWLASFSYHGNNPNVRLGQRRAKAYGWHVGYEWDSLYTLWNYESGWNHRAYNPSGACGIPQDMGDCHGFDPAAQIDWGLKYVKAVYGCPSAAYAHWRANNWY